MIFSGSYSKNSDKFKIKANFSSSIADNISGNSLSGSLDYNLNEDINIKGNISIYSHQPNYNFSLFKSNYTSGKRKSRVPLIFYAIGYLTHTINFNVTIFF